MLHAIRKLSSRLFFRLLYLKRPVWDSGITPPELTAFLESHPPGRAMDLGCGTGTNLLTMRQYGWQVTGIDFVPKAIRQARRKAQTAGLDVTLIAGDVSDPDLYQGHYDLILDIGCYHVLSPGQRERYHRNLADHLAPGGTFLLYGFTSADQSRISSQDVNAFEKILKLEKRVDGVDTGSGPASAWFWFKTKE
jgi:SAM-dependent methyltransferase